MHNEPGVDINSPAYQAGIVAAIASMSSAQGRVMFDQAVSDGILDAQDANIAFNQGEGVNFLLEFHQLHGDLGEQDVSTY